MYTDGLNININALRSNMIRASFNLVQIKVDGTESLVNLHLLKDQSRICFEREPDGVSLDMLSALDQHLTQIGISGNYFGGEEGYVVIPVRQVTQFHPSKTESFELDLKFIKSKGSATIVFTGTAPRDHRKMTVNVKHPTLDSIFDLDKIWNHQTIEAV